MEPGEIISNIMGRDHWMSPLTLAGVGLLAVVLVAALPWRPRRSERIGRILRRDIVIMTVLPLLSLSLVFTDRSMRHLSEGMAASLEAAATGLAGILADRLEKAQDAVAGLALALERAPRLSEAGVEELLVGFHQINGEFISTLAADPDGRVVAATMALPEGVRAVDAGTVTVTDREYFRKPLDTGDRYLSSAFLGRGLGSDVIVAASAPVAGPVDRKLAVVEASIDFVRLGMVGRDFPLPESAEFVILDPAGRVAASSHPDEFGPLSIPGRDALGGNGEREYLVAGRQTANGWTVVVRLPRARLGERVAADLFISAIWLSAALALALTMAAAVTSRVSGPLRTLADAVKDYLPPAPTDRIAVSSSAPQEVRMLARHFNLSARRMNELYSRLAAMLRERESRDGG